MQIVLGTYDRLARAVLAALSAWIGIVVFPPFGIGALFVLFALWCLVEAATGWCPLHQRLQMDRRANVLLGALLAVQLSLAYGWAVPGVEKIAGHFAQDLPKTLQFFASKNPYAWYVRFLQGYVLPNASWFGVVIAWAELLVGIVLVLSCAAIALGNARWRTIGYAASLVALIGGLAMNANFWIAAGWTSPGTAGANTAMFWPELALVYVWGAFLFRRDIENV